MRLGLSPSRAAWMEQWTRKLSVSGKVTAKEMEQGLGRLGFAANALTWERPFLGPLYSWTAAVRTKKCIFRIPAMLRTVLWFLAERTREGGSLQEPTPLRAGAEDDDVFFTDAKATEDETWIGGFLQSNTGEYLRGFRKRYVNLGLRGCLFEKTPSGLLRRLNFGHPSRYPTLGH